MKWTSHSHIFLHKWNIRAFFKRLCSLIRIVFSFYACQPSALLFKVLSPRSIFCLFTYFGVFLSEWWFFQYISGSEVWGCFVGPTWKCLFYSTSCFQRPFVNFSCNVCVCECVLASLSGGQPRSMQEDILQLLDHYFLFFPEFPVPASCPANVLARFVCLLVWKAASLMGSGQRSNSLFTATDGIGSSSVHAGVHAPMFILHLPAMITITWTRKKHLKC